MRAWLAASVFLYAAFARGEQPAKSNSLLTECRPLSQSNQSPYALYFECAPDCDRFKALTPGTAQYVLFQRLCRDRQLYDAFGTRYPQNSK